jgi:hypothetical protein
MHDPELESVRGPLSTNLWEVDVVGPLSGEKRLMAAVLGDAMHSFLRYHPSLGGSAGPLFREVQHWFMSGDRSRFVSFENVCDVLGIDAERLRRTLIERANAGVRFVRADGRRGPKLRL